MKSLVYLQPSCSGVLLVAVNVVADEGFFASMRQFVGLKVPFGNELLLALVAHEGSLSRVCPHVRLQIASLGELLQALFKRTHQYFFLIFWSFHFLNRSYS